MQTFGWNELYESKLTEKEVRNTLNQMENNKTTGDTLKKELIGLKFCFYYLSKKGFWADKLSISQKQLITELLDTKDWEKRLIKNWTTIKFMSNALAKRIKKLLRSLLSCNQTVYVENRDL